ncbi:MAG: hypothetical protein LAO08_04895 [Acidobacteriia bacterium]|nr:hypothetical protein [Terriglobia bacterium]
MISRVPISVAGHGYTFELQNNSTATGWYPWPRQGGRGSDPRSRSAGYRHEPSLAFSNLSRKTFCTFLRARKQFSTEFTTDDLAKKSYEQSRSGILHQAEIGGDSNVWSIGPLLRVKGNAITLNRNKFHDCLKAEFQSYLSELHDSKNSTLRKNFRKKMNFISKI